MKKLFYIFIFFMLVFANSPAKAERVDNFYRACNISIRVYYDGNNVTLKDKDGKEICSFETPSSNQEVTEIVSRRYVIYKYDNKYGWYDLKKHKFSDKEYEKVEARPSKWFSVITGRDYPFYRENGKWHNSQLAPLTFKRIALLPIELPLAVLNDSTKLVILVASCGAMYILMPSCFEDWWILKGAG